MLWRCWGDEFNRPAAVPHALWVCLNPSTAGAKAEDQTTLKIRGFTERMGLRAYVLMNLYDLRATDPRELYAAERKGVPLALPGNFRAIAAAARAAAAVVCAWGRHGNALPMGGSALLQHLAVECLSGKLRALRTNVDGTPAHPLMLPFSLKPVPYP